MKFIVTLVSTLALVEAQQTTTNNCLLEEDAISVGDCKSLFYNRCSKFKIAS